jgi:CHAT domain-containing protein
MPGNPPLQRHVVAYGPDQQFSYLPGTLQEARNLEHILAAKGVLVRLFTGEQAGEEQLKAVCAQPENRPQLLHIATHGFHFKVDGTLYGGEAGLDNPFAQQTHPLMRSGLALAGANRVWSGEAISEDREDGIATAFEISQLDLTGTQLAVLSACGTGRGDIKGAEGVYGLQRGFKLAGARYLMLSLWAVPDRETAVFMQYFYRQWAKGNTLSDAFDQAQKKMRKRFKEPEYWAAWMLLE